MLLTSFAAVEDETGLDMSPRRLYAIVQMKWLGEVFEVGTIRIVPYQTVCSKFIASTIPLKVFP